MDQGIRTRSMAALYPKNIDRCKGALLPKMAYYKDHSMNFSKDGFIQRPRHTVIYKPHRAHKAIGQLKVYSHQLEDQGKMSTSCT